MSAYRRILADEFYASAGFDGVAPTQDLVPRCSAKAASAFWIQRAFASPA